jgi:hypothetical protein
MIVEKPQKSKIVGKKRKKFQQGLFKPRNPHKYVGQVDKIYYRSGWEKAVFRWCDRNDAIIFWNSEEIVIPYICPVDNQPHRYFVDLLIRFANKQQILVEIKPAKQTVLPEKKTGPWAIHHHATYAKNKAKWEAASRYAEHNGMKFFVWTEEDLKRLKIQTK